MTSEQYGVNLRDWALKRALRDYPVGQQRTARGKQFVFYLGKWLARPEKSKPGKFRPGDYVIKGPYLSGDKITNLKQRVRQFKKWQTSFILYPEHFFEADGGTWVIYRNLATQDLTTATHTEKFGDQLSYQIAERTEVMKLSDVLKKGAKWPLKQAQKLLLAYVEMFLLNVGDLGLANTLVYPHEQLAIIDYEEERGKFDYSKDHGPEFYFSRSTAKEFWFAATKQHYRWVAERISALPDVPDSKRLKYAITQLNRYGSKTVDASDTDDSDQSSRSNRSTPSDSSRKSTTRVVNVRVSHLRPKYANLKEWCADPNNQYIGRGRIVVIDDRRSQSGLADKDIPLGGERYPPEDSSWANPYRLNSDGSNRDEVLEKYRQYITEKIARGEVDLEELRGKGEGADDRCHGDILVELLDETETNVSDSSDVSEDSEASQGKVKSSKASKAFMGRATKPDKSTTSTKPKIIRIGFAKTPSGESDGVIRSALQKYIRRGYALDAVACAFQLYSFKDRPEGKAITTNLYNRLAIILCEDIGPANLELLWTGLLMLSKRNLSESELFGLVDTMARSPKTRIMSWLKYVYTNPTGIEAAEDAGIDVSLEHDRDDDQVIARMLTKFDFSELGEVGRIGGSSNSASSAREGRELRKGLIWLLFFAHYLEQRDRRALIYLGYFLEWVRNGEKTFKNPRKGPRRSFDVREIGFPTESSRQAVQKDDLDPTLDRIPKGFRGFMKQYPAGYLIKWTTENPLQWLWVILSYYVPEYVFIPFAWWGKETSTREKDTMVAAYALITAILFTPKGKAIQTLRVEHRPKLDEFLPWYRWYGIYDSIVKLTHPITILDYVKDKHTHGGSGGTKKFVQEGALVNHQSPKYYDPVLEKLYMSQS
jgi:hypothetical protein